MDRLLISFVLFLSFFLVNFLNASVVLTDDVTKKTNFEIQYYYDISSSLTINTIEKIAFQETIPSQFTKGYKYENAWFKIDIINKSKNEDFVLYFTESIWSTLDLYTKENGSWKVQKNGLHIPLKDRTIQDSSPAYPLHLQTGESISLYVKGSTIASQIGEFQIYTKDEYYKPTRITQSQWYIIYSFILFSFILLNIYNFIMTKESIYGYYILYVFIYIVFVSMHSGIYINFGLPTWDEGLHTLGVLTLLSLLLFSREFLELKKTYPTMEKIFTGLAIGAFVFTLLLSQNVPYATVASNIFFSVSLIIIIYAAIMVKKNGFKTATYYLIALMLYLPSMAMMAMNFNTFLDNTDLTRYSFLGGAFFEIFLFTLILTNRYKDIRKLNNLLVVKTNELENLRGELEKESVTDFLSGLYNRRYFFEISHNSYSRAQRYNKELSVVMIDIDNFKAINDTYGHQSGDTVIQTISQIIQNLLRDADTPARYGGEEFIILLPNTTKDESFHMAERIRQKIESTTVNFLDANKHNITVSIGITQLDFKNDANVEQVILRADAALYKAKDNGKNRIEFL